MKLPPIGPCDVQTVQSWIRSYRQKRFIVISHRLAFASVGTLITRYLATLQLVDLLVFLVNGLQAACIGFALYMLHSFFSIRGAGFSRTVIAPEELTDLEGLLAPSTRHQLLAQLAQRGDKTVQVSDLLCLLETGTSGREPIHRT